MSNNDYIEYPDSMVMHDDRAIGYFTAALKAGVDAVRYVMNQPEYLALLGLDSIPVNMDAPDETQRYPYIHVMYQSTKIQPISLDASNFAWYQKEIPADQVERSAETAVVDMEDWYDLYRFDGSYTINVYANTILEREKISDVCIAAMAIDRRFRRYLIDNAFINIAPNMSTFDMRTSTESWGTPWSPDVMTAFRNFSFQVTGEFLYRYATTVQFISSMPISATIEGEATTC